MKRKPKVYKIMPYIFILMFWHYSDLNAEQTSMIIIVCVIFYALCIASADAWVSTEKRKEKSNE